MLKVRSVAVGFGLDRSPAMFIVIPIDNAPVTATQSGLGAKPGSLRSDSISDFGRAVYEYAETVVRGRKQWRNSRSGDSRVLPQGAQGAQPESQCLKLTD
jgi:hypothetical protein